MVEVLGVNKPSRISTLRRAIIKARTALLSMRLNDASKYVSDLKQLLGRTGRTDLLHVVLVLEASLLSLKEEFVEARLLLLQLPALHSDMLSAVLLRYLTWKLNEPGEPAAPDTVDYLASPLGKKAVCRIVSLCVSAAIAFDRLQLTMSADLATEALLLARVRFGNHSPMASLPATLLAQVAYEQGRLDEAEALLRPRLTSIPTSGMPVFILRARLILARISLHRGQRGFALPIPREAAALGPAHHCSRFICAASSVINARSHAPTYGSVEHLLQRASSAASSGCWEDSYAILIPCLRIGVTSGLRMVFRDAARALPTLLERVYHALPKDDPALSDLRPYIATLLRATVSFEISSRDSTTTYQTLSQRETAILQAIAHGMSNKRIAQSLGIAPETVKSHAKSIFAKLATRTRAQAVARAEAIGLLS
jgi:LuxR family transcriptional regulator, maltose regulon positive regulatory protein